jgi:2-oxoglutarate/2-oxoacid ferredoxin oxidoreductase subunit alpha
MADAWNVPALVLADGMIGQMIEGVVLPEPKDPGTRVAKPWASGNRGARPANHISSEYLFPDDCELINNQRYKRYAEMKKELVRFEEVNSEKSELILVAYGTSARVSLGAMQLARKLGIEVGLFRPITLWPFPDKRLAELAAKGKRFLCVEMSMGQMIEDVKLSVNGKSDVLFYGRCGGNIPSEEEVLAEIRRILKK